jgi:cyclopropane-fatty-acyl-phospholipid synthase
VSAGPAGRLVPASRTARVEPPSLPAVVAARVDHTRHHPLRHSFSYRQAFWLVDLDDLPARRFRATDHLAGGTSPAAPAAVGTGAKIMADLQAVLERHGRGWQDGDRAVMLAQPRRLGHVFDPLTVFWHLGADGTLRELVLEVHNTYGGRHCYVVPGESFTDGEAEVDKAFYVSPFNDEHGGYTVRVQLTREQVEVSIVLRRESITVLTARVTGRALALDDPAARPLLRFDPLATVRVSARIRAHGLRLRTRGLPVQPRPGRDRGLGVRGRLARWVLRLVARRVPVRIVLPDGATLGRAGSNADPELPVIEVVRPAEVYRRLGRDPKLGIGEAYTAGDWRAAAGTDLAAALAPFATRLTTAVPPALQRFRRLTDRAMPPDRRNTPRGARRNIQAHYDLSNELFAAFLDETMTYSSALFADGDVPWPQQSLADAQRRKTDAVLDRAGVGAGTRLLEIGTGWGHLAVTAARRGARVTTVTLSREQATLARRRALRAGVADRVDVRVQDYRDVTEQFDAIVSVEMIEAVGEEFWPVYLRAIEARLAEGGIAAVQSILMSDERYLATRHSHGWVQQHIFPGGLIPSLEALQRTTAGHTGLRIEAVHRYGPHYAETLRRWRRQFTRNWPALAGHGFDEAFRRRWEFYLAYCEAGFSTGYLDVAQFTLRRQP